MPIFQGKKIKQISESNFICVGDHLQRCKKLQISAHISLISGMFVAHHLRKISPESEILDLRVCFTSWCSRDQGIELTKQHCTKHPEAGHNIHTYCCYFNSRNSQTRFTLLIRGKFFFNTYL